MIVWLDHLIFGNGHGLRSPYFDNCFYWLSGEFYTWIGGFGAQLQSFGWRHPKPGTERQLCGRTFRVFNSHRKGPRVDISWALVGLPHDIDMAHAEIRRLKADLGS